MAAETALRVDGLGELQRAFYLTNREMGKDFKEALRSSADPVRSSAESQAQARIRRIGMPWSRMRVGVTRTLVYVAPVQRGVASRTNPRRRRPNLKSLLLERALEPALEQNIHRVDQEFEDAVSDMARFWSRV